MLKKIPSLLVAASLLITATPTLARTLSDIYPNGLPSMVPSRAQTTTHPTIRLPDTGTPSADSLSDSLLDTLHTEYCQSLSTVLRRTCLQTELTTSQRNRFNTLYTNWLRQFQDDFKTMMNAKSNTATTPSTNTPANTVNTNDATWDATSDGKWMGNNGEWLTLMNGTLMWSTDSGLTWSEVPNGAWQQGTNWYRFNASGNLEQSMNGGVTWDAAPNNRWMGKDGTWYHLDANHRLETQETDTDDDVPSTTTSNTTDILSPDARRQQMLDDYDACKNVSPRRFSSCLEDRESARADANTETDDQ